MNNCITVRNKEYCEYQPYLKAEYIAIGATGVVVVAIFIAAFLLLKKIKNEVGF